MSPFIDNMAMPALVTLGITLVLGIAIAFIHKKFHVEQDETVSDILEILPGANCGACGYTGCEGYAVALAKNPEESLTKCTVGGEDCVEDLSVYLGKAAGEFIPQTAVVICQGSSDHTKVRYEYDGIPTCAAAENLQRGPGSCSYGCMGFGDCKAVCEYGAIEIRDGLARIDADLCTACNKCVVACPKNIITMYDKYSNLHVVRCANTLAGNYVRKQCEVGCIACLKCVKACPEEAITMRDNIAYIDQAKCTQCGICVTECPTDTITGSLIK